MERRQSWQRKNKDGLEYLWTDKKRTLFGLPLSFTRYYLTESRLITRVGLLTVVEDELDIYRINDKKMELPLGQRLFGCGTIILFSKDVDTPEKHIHSIKNPRDVSDLITVLINEQRDRFRHPWTGYDGSGWYAAGSMGR